MSRQKLESFEIVSHLSVLESTEPILPHNIYNKADLLYFKVELFEYSLSVIIVIAIIMVKYCRRDFNNRIVHS